MMVRMTVLPGVKYSNSGIVLSEQICFQRAFECSLGVQVANVMWKRVPLLSSTEGGCPLSICDCFVGGNMHIPQIKCYAKGRL